MLYARRVLRPRLAGTASGLGGAMMLAGGAALSALAGWALTEGGTEVPLLIIMLMTSTMGVLAILVVFARERQLST